MQRDAMLPRKCITQGGAQRIHRAAFNAGFRDHCLTALRHAAEGKCNALERCAGETLTQMIRPGNGKAHIGWGEGARGDARQQRGPYAIRPKPRPGSATKCQNGG